MRVMLATLGADYAAKGEGQALSVCVCVPTKRWAHRKRVGTQASHAQTLAFILSMCALFSDVVA